MIRSFTPQVKDVKLAGLKPYGDRAQGLGLWIY